MAKKLTQAEEKILDHVKMVNGRGALAGLSATPFEEAFSSSKKHRFIKRLYDEGHLVWVTYTDAFGAGWAVPAELPRFAPALCIQAKNQPPIFKIRDKSTSRFFTTGYGWTSTLSGASIKYFPSEAKAQEFIEKTFVAHDGVTPKHDGVEIVPGP